MQQTTEETRRSDPERGDPSPRSSPSQSEGTPPGSDGEEAGRVASAYLRIFGRPPLGDHPELDGYAAGRLLGERYAGAMLRVMNGFRQGAAEAQKTAKAGGESQ